MEEKYRWENFPYEVQQYLAVRFFLIVLGYIAILFFLVTTHILSAGILFFTVLTVYLFFQIHFYYQIINRQIIVYTGICEKKNTPSVDIVNPFSLLNKSLFRTYGHCTVTLLIGNNKLLVPVSAGFVVENGNEVRVYTHVRDVIKRNDNTYAINNPFIVKVSKT